MASPSLKTAETDALKIYMIQRAVSVEMLAKKCGVSVVTMRNQIAKNFPSLRLRLVVEDVLSNPFWTDISEFESRQRLSSWLGIDPFVLSVPELRKKISQMKIRGRSASRKREVLIGLLQQVFHSHQNHQPQSQTT